MKSCKNTTITLVTALCCLFLLPYIVSAEDSPWAKKSQRGNEGENEPLSVKVYPNPATEYVIFSIMVETPGFTEIKVCDLNGRSLYYQAASHLIPGFYTYIWEPQHPTKGVVLFEIIHDGSRRQSGQVIITPP